MPPTPPTRTLLLRGLTMRCPVCGQGGLFRRWVVMVEDCPRCELRFERVEGHWIGAIGMNTIVSFGVVLAVVVAGVAATVPDVPAGRLAAVAVAVAVVVPVACYPASKTLWTAIDLRMRPLPDRELGTGPPDA